MIIQYWKLMIILNRIALIIFSVSILTACSEFLNGKPKKEAAYEIKAESVNCIKDINSDFKKFIKSEATDSEIDKTFDCIDNVLKEFGAKVQGSADPDSFTSDELHQISKKLIKDSNLSKTSINDLLVLKSAVIGGSDQKITKTEIKSLSQYLVALKAEVKNLLPYAQLLTLKKTEITYTKSTIKSAFAQLNLSLKNLLRLSKISHSSYQFSDFKKLIINLDTSVITQTAKNSDPIDLDQEIITEISEKKKDIIILAEKVNDLLLGRQLIATEQDGILYIDSLTELLRLYTLQVQGYVKFVISDAEQMQNTLEYVTDLIVLLENTTQFKKTKIISFETLDPVLEEILRKDILPFKLTADTALNFYKTILVRVFELGRNGNIADFAGINKMHFKNLKRELAAYRIYSQFIKDLFAGNNKKISLKDAQEKLQSFDISKEQESTQEVLREFDLDTQAQIIKIVVHLKVEFLQKSPVLYRANKIILATNQEIWEQSWVDLARGLYVTMLARELMLGWGETPLATTNHVTEKGMVQWYDEFKPMGTETKVFDPRTKNSGVVNLLAANLFTRSGDGDNRITFREAIEFLGILFSSGGQVYHEIKDNLEKSGCHLSDIDVFENNWNEEVCAYDNLRKNYKHYFSNLPYLVRYLDKLNKNEEGFKSFYESLMQVARTDITIKDRLETADLRGLSALLHYIESIFSIYDSDKNSALSENEIRAAYPRFKAFAEKFARKNSSSQVDSFNSWKGKAANYGCFTEQDLVRESFIFLVYNGRTPKLSDLTILPCLRKQPLLKFKGEVDRKGIIKTFKIIKSQG